MNEETSCMKHIVPHNHNIDYSIVFKRTLLKIISGARYSGVPHNVQVLPFTRLAKPKSVTYVTHENYIILYG